MVHRLAARRRAGPALRPGLEGRVRLLRRGGRAGSAVSVFVDPATVRAAGERAATLPLTAAEQDRWQRAVRHAAEHAVDPTPRRVAELSELLGLRGQPDAEVLAAAGRVLAGELAGAPDGRAEEVRRRCVG